MQYALEFHTALITVSSVFMAIAGIMVAIALSRENTDRKLSRLFIGLVLGSLIPGILSMVFALTWFSTPADSKTIMAVILLLVQFLVMYLPLWGLLTALIRR